MVLGGNNPVAYLGLLVLCAGVHDELMLTRCYREAVLLVSPGTGMKNVGYVQDPKDETSS